MDPTRDPGLWPNPFLIPDVEHVTDAYLRDHVAIYKNLRDRLSTSARSAVGVHEQVASALAALEAEVVRRG
jgi:hypothetical protein